MTFVPDWHWPQSTQPTWGLEILAEDAFLVSKLHGTENIGFLGGFDPLPQTKHPFSFEC